MEYKGDFKKFARDQLAAIFADPEYGTLYQHIAAKAPEFADVSVDLFSMEYLGAKLALSARGWEEACADVRVSEAGISKIFFQSAMDCFQSPKMTPLAAAFSEAYYAVEDKPLKDLALMLAARLFEKLRPGLAGDKARGREEALQMVMESLESFRNTFENRFHDFIITCIRF